MQLPLTEPDTLLEELWQDLPPETPYQLTLRHNPKSRLPEAFPL